MDRALGREVPMSSLPGFATAGGIGDPPAGNRHPAAQPAPRRPASAGCLPSSGSSLCDTFQAGVSLSEAPHRLAVLAQFNPCIAEVNQALGAVEAMTAVRRPLLLEAHEAFQGPPVHPAPHRHDVRSAGTGSRGRRRTPPACGRPRR